MSKYYRHEDIVDMIEQGFSIDTDGDKAYVIYELLPSLPTIEVSEDCISREYLKSFEHINKGDFNSVETIREWIDNAPSVVPNDIPKTQIAEEKTFT